MRTITDDLTVRPGNKHWEILCPPGNLARLFGGFALGVGKIGRHSDDGLVDRLAQIFFGNTF